MRQSLLFGKTKKETPKDEVSINASLLIRAGFIDKLAAGIYTYLPLGLRVLERIQNIIRKEMNNIGAQEIRMPALHPQEPWKKTGRWTQPGTEVMFQFKGHNRAYGLGWTHEEIVTPLVKQYVHSYKDLPIAVYQIQDKFRNEPRAKSGLLRGREFNMKDLYSFHATEEDLERYYEKVMLAYSLIFEQCGLAALVTEASGGAFSKYSHEYQVITPNGEDTIFACAACDHYQNKEIVENPACPTCGKQREEQKAIEVGNIFKLGTRFSDAFDLTYLTEEGVAAPVLMGCYGMGPSRILGTIAEIHHDDRGLMWPATTAPFQAHLLMLGEEDAVRASAEAWYHDLEKAGIAVLFDDRDLSAGEKFADCDLIGIPYRLVVSKKTGEGAELKTRSSSDTRIITMREGQKLLTHV
ncbi:MAG: aminoacyl--tRNA ligase-related protein [Patescibacteria group bacterium]